MRRSENVQNLESWNGLPPVPAVILAVGEFGKAAVQPVMEIYLRGDSRRRNVTQVFWVGSQGANFGPDHLLVEQAGETAGQNPVEISQAAFQSVIAQKSAVRTALEQALHQSRTHENLISAGWLSSQDVPVNMYLIADLTDPLSAGMLMPLIRITQEICSTDLLSSTLLLLNVAAFPNRSFEEYQEVQARVLRALQDVRGILDTKSAQWQKLSSFLDLSLPTGIPPAIFLFDRRKEGSAEVKDPDGMKTLMGNGLLALLEGNTARKLADSNSRQFEDEQGYHSIGAALIAYDPGSAQVPLGNRAAREFLESQLLGEPASSLALDEEVLRLEQVIGTSAVWIETLISSLPRELSKVHPGEEAFSVRADLSGFSFSEPDYENMSDLPWGTELARYAIRIVEMLAEAEPALLHASRQLECNLCALLAQESQMLARSPRMYPGGVRTARMVLNDLTARLRAQQREMERQVALRSQEWDMPPEDIGSITERMRHEQLKIAPLPWFIKLMPEKMRKKAAAMYSLWKFLPSITSLLRLRKQAIQTLEAWYADAIFRMILSRLRTVVDGLLDVTLAESTNLDEMEAALRGTASAFMADNDQVKGTHHRNGWDDFLRLPAFQDGWLEFVYQNKHPNFAVWLAEYLADDTLFIGDKPEEMITAWLAKHGSDAFSFLGMLTVDEVLRQQEETGLYSLSRLMAASIPPLRPDYDASGGSAQMSFHAQFLADPEWSACQVPQTSAAQWETIYTGNPYIALWLQARAGIPHSAFESAIPTSSSNGHGTWSILTATDEVDSSEQAVSFSWSFQPRGGKNAVPQQIDLRIDRARLEHYRRLARFRGQWNRYAEAEMPEIRELALAFQSLHARKHWSTYNQASNVLAFVQQSIPYQNDLLTTGHEDWPRYPIETLADCTGDCEDVAILCAAVLARLGFQVILLVYEQHLAFAVAGAEKLKGAYITNPRTGARCFYGEATAKGWCLGEVPKAYAGIDPVEVLPVSILMEMETDDTEN